jgi:hypothetical protein
MISNGLKEFDITPKFFFTNNVFNKKSSGGGVPLHNIYPAADIFNLANPQATAHLPSAFIYDNFSENLKKRVADLEVYHLLYVGNQEQSVECDLKVNALVLRDIYKAYKTITLCGNKNIYSSQLFFDAILNAHKVDVIRDDEEELFENLLTTIFNCNLEDEGNDVAYEVRQQIKSRQTPFHRAWTLMKHLKNEEAQKRLEKAKTEVSNILSGI